VFRWCGWPTDDNHAIPLSLAHSLFLTCLLSTWWETIDQRLAPWAGFRGAYSVAWEGASDSQLTFVRYLLRAYQLRASMYAPASVLAAGADGAAAAGAAVEKGMVAPPAMLDTLRSMAARGHEVGVRVDSKAARAVLPVALRRLGDVTRRNYSASVAFAQYLDLPSSATSPQAAETFTYALGGYDDCPGVKRADLASVPAALLSLSACTVHGGHTASDLRARVEDAIAGTGWVIERGRHVQSCADGRDWIDGRPNRVEAQHRITGQYWACRQHDEGRGKTDGQVRRATHLLSVVLGVQHTPRIELGTLCLCSSFALSLVACRGCPLR
jgi:hypothetical protein